MNQRPTDEIESSILTFRPNFLARHRRISGALSCGIFAALAAIVVQTGMHAFEHNVIVLYAALSALIPGWIFGAQILDHQITKSAWGAIWRGAVIVLISHVVFVFILCGKDLAKASSWGEIPTVIVLGLMFAGWVTMPIGSVAAIALYKIRGLGSRPKGCTIHKYGAP